MVIRRNNTSKKDNKKLRTSTATSTNDLNAKIQEKAYCLFEKRGYSHGSDWSDWFEAEKHVKRDLGLR